MTKAISFFSSLLSLSLWDNITQVGMTWAESVIPMKLLGLSATQSQTVANRTVIYQELSLQAHCLMTPGADPLCLPHPRAAHTHTHALIKLSSGEKSLWKWYHRDFAEGLVNYRASVYLCRLQKSAVWIDKSCELCAWVFVLDFKFGIQWKMMKVNNLYLFFWIVHQLLSIRN